MNKIPIPPVPVLLQDLGMHFPMETSKKKYRYGIYKCSCGSEFKSQCSSVNRGSTHSCGCYQMKCRIERSTTHGLSHNKLYHTWCNIINRITNKKHKRFNDYGGRGITACDRWLHSFENFQDDMLPTWKEGLSIDRINNDGNYEPNNCRWTTRDIQQQNQRIIRSTNTSGYRGVAFHNKANKWRAEISVNNKRIYLGLFQTDIEASIAYDTYVIRNNLEHTINGIL